MSVGLAVGPATSTVGPLDTRRLMITLARTGGSEMPPDGTCPVYVVDALLERVLESRTVLVERRDGGRPVRLRSRAARESDVAWLSRVLAEVLGQLTDTTLACTIVGDAIRRTAEVPVAIECWPADQDAPRPVAAPHSWPTWRGEIPLVRSARGFWMLVGPTGSTGLEAEYPSLLAALTRHLCEADADEVQAQNALRRQLARAVSCGDPVAFVGAAAQLLDGSVCLRDNTGALVAASGPSVDGPRAHATVLRDGSCLRGSLVIDTEREPADLGLADLALALLRLRAADGERGALENRLAVLGCFVDRELDHPYQARPARARRIVMISSAGPGMVPAGALIVSRLLRAAAEVPMLADLSLAAQDDVVLGAYSDDGSAAEAHRRSWWRLLREVDRGGGLRVAVGAVASTPRAGDSKAQYQIVSQVSRLQRDGAALFDVPAVAVVDELGPLTGVLNAVPGAQVLPYVQRVLGDLITDGRFGGQLIDTLYAYLQTGGSPRGAGALLHLHGSSVKYRMRILRELLGERLEDPSKRFDLELALRLYLAQRELAVGLTQ